MAKFVCQVCGYVYEGDAAPEFCPVCKAPAEKSTVDFADNASIADYAADSVYALKYAGIMKGDENANFNPTNPANRAEAAMVIYAVIK